MNQDRLAVYGHLLWDEPYLDQLGVRAGLRPIGKCRLRGRLYSLGYAPALVDGAGFVQGFLYQVRDPRVWDVLNKYEEYDPHNEAASKYVLRETQLAHPAGHALVYLYNGPVKGLQRITHGDWMKHIRG